MQTKQAPFVILVPGFPIGKDEGALSTYGREEPGRGTGPTSEVLSSAHNLACLLPAL